MNPALPFTVVDLTHPLHEGMPVWPGDPPVQIVTAAERERDGFLLQRISCGEHSGTHAGAPRHFLAEGPAMAEMPAERLVARAVRISRCLGRDELFAPEAVIAWEAEHGAIPLGSAVVIETGWSRFWPDAGAYFALDAAGTMHFPGISVAAMRLLVEERGVTTVGIDSAGLDGGMSTDYQANILLARHGGLHLENLAGLDRIPPTGAWLVIGALPIAGGSGSPARVLALVMK
jgi:kynurenine formamidase